MDDDCKEQQLQEIEALESMYGNEFTALCKDYPEISIQVEVRPDSLEFEKLFGKETVFFRARFPADYPNAGPLMDLDDLECDQDGDENSSDDSKRPSKFFISKIEEELNKTIEESLGMPMLFTLIQCFQESLEHVCKQHTEELAEMSRKLAEQAEKEERAKFEGTRVTVESFNNWNKAFLEEMRLKGEKDNKSAQTSNRLTGKQMFLADKSLNLSDLQFLNLKEDESKLDGGEKVEIDQSLFEDDLEMYNSSSDEDYQPDPNETDE